MHILSAIHFLFIINFGFHDFHVSVMDIKYVETGSLEVELRIFADDLEEALNAKYSTSLDLLNSKNTIAVDSLAYLYFKEHIFIKINEEKLKLGFLGSESDNGMIYCYFEIPEIRKINSIEVKNTILTDLFNDQSNLVNIYANAGIHSMKLEANNVSETITW